MRASVSLKVFLGFIAVVVAFGAAAVFELLRSHEAQEDLRRLNQVYLRLNDVYRALDTRVTQLSLLHRNSRDLIKTSTGARSWAHINRYMPLAQRYRDKRLDEIRRIARSALSIDLPASDRRFLKRLGQETHKLEQDFEREDRIYKQVFVQGASAPGGADRVAAGTQRLLRTMAGSRKRLRQIGTSLRRLLSRNLAAHVRRTAQRLENNETTTLLYSIVLTIFALLVAVAMMLLAHWTLKPLRTLRTGAQIIGQGDYGHRVRIRARDEIGDLAAEFNAMAAAIEEREHRLIETERKAAREKRLATVGRAAAQITHEVRNPLSAIGLNAEMLEEELTGLPAEGEVEEARALLSAIQREVDRLTDVTESYLQFARLPRPRPEVEDLGPVIESVVEFARGELEADGLRLACQLDPLPPLSFDENQIRQALLNLLRNAREAMPEGGGAITVRATVAADQVEIQVADRGPGMDPDALKQMFDPFFTTKEKGTGLGLAITSQIVEEHGGSIRAEPRFGGGLRIVITLPREPGAGALGAGASGAGEPGAGALGAGASGAGEPGAGAPGAA